MTGLIVNIDVPDLTAAITFYEQGLGFKLIRMLFDRSVAELSAGSTKVYLIEHAEGSKAVANTDIDRNYSPHWTPVHLDVLVEDLESAVEKAVNAGATCSAEISEARWGKLAPLRDPFGHGVCLLELVGSGYDLVAD